MKAFAGMLSFQGEISLHERLNSKKQTAAYGSEVNFAEAEPVFPEFLLFNQELATLYHRRKPGQTLKDIYPAFIKTAWFTTSGLEQAVH